MVALKEESCALMPDRPRLPVISYGPAIARGPARLGLAGSRVRHNASRGVTR